MTDFFTYMLAGVVGGVLNAALVGARQAPHRGAPLAVCLGVAAGIYVGFGLQDARPNHVLAEVLGALPFIAVAVRWPHATRIMGIAWLAHGVLDGVHALGVVATPVPYWYPGACLGWDAVLGVAGLYWGNARGHPDEADTVALRKERS